MKNNHFNTVKIFVPDVLKVWIKNVWHKIVPPRIYLTLFNDDGVVFEITSKMEKSRVRSYGDEAESVERVLSEVKQGDVFYDVGSCVGLYSIHVALLGASVIAFEPDPSYRKRLKRNIRINNLRKKIKVLDWAVSDKAGNVTLYTDGVEGNSPSLRQVGSRGNVIVRTDTIDNAIRKKQIPAPNIVKLDIEGAEILALRGMKKLLTSSKAPRFLFVEFHPEFLPDYASSFEECKKLVEEFGYRNEYSFKRSDQYHYFFRK